MRCQGNLDVASALREAREQQGLSQRRLALRAGTSQDAISRIERGVEAPTLERLARLMLVMGYRLVLSVEPLPSQMSDAELAVVAAMTPAERLRDASKRNRVASQRSRADGK